MPDPNDILSALHELAVQGRDVGALDLHIRGLLAARAGDFDACSSAFAAAQRWESSRGHRRAALHTSHQLALATNFQGDIEKLTRYYRETLRTLKRLSNREGMALCLRSIGELSLINGNTTETVKAWELSGRFFAVLQLSEREQISAWLVCMRELVNI